MEGNWAKNQHINGLVQYCYFLNGRKFDLIIYIYIYIYIYNVIGCTL